MTCQTPYHPANLECLLMTPISRVWVNSLQLTLSLPRGPPLTSKIVWRSIDRGKSISVMSAFTAVKKLNLNHDLDNLIKS